MITDGSYYAKGRCVFRHPKKTEGGFAMGFCVCELASGVSEDGAQEIADALNEADSRKRWNEVIAANREGQEA